MNAVSSNTAALSAASASAGGTATAGNAADPGSPASLDSLLGFAAGAPASGDVAAVEGTASAVPNFRQLLSNVSPEPVIAAQLIKMAVDRSLDPGCPAGAEPQAAVTASAIPQTSGAGLLSQLAPLSVPKSANAAAVEATPQRDSGEVNADTDDDSKDATQPDPLLLVLAALSQLGFVAPPATATATAPTSAEVADAIDVSGNAVATGNGGNSNASATSAGSNSTGDAAAQMLPSFRNALPAQTLGTSASGTSRTRAGDTTAAKTSLAAKDAKGADLLSAFRLQVPATATAVADAPGRDGAWRDRTRDDSVADLTAGGGAATSASAVAATSTANQDSDPVTRTIEVPVQHSGWSEAVSSQIRMFAEQGVQRATLHLTPGHLGPVEVRLSLDKGQVDVNFSAANPETRAALEQSLPQLRDLLGGAGLSLGQAQVQQQMRQGSQNAFQSGGRAADTDVGETLSRVPMRLGLVDEYA